MSDRCLHGSQRSGSLETLLSIPTSFCRIQLRSSKRPKPEAPKKEAAILNSSIFDAYKVWWPSCTWLSSHRPRLPSRAQNLNFHSCHPRQRLQRPIASHKLISSYIQNDRQACHRPLFHSLCGCCCAGWQRLGLQHWEASVLRFYLSETPIPSL